MPVLVKYSQKELRGDKLELVRQCIGVLQAYEQQGLVLTLRGLYYQLVGKNVIPNKPEWYGRLGDAVADGRMAGLIGWDQITDRTRGLVGSRHYSHPKEAFKAARDGYRVDMWANQEWRPEVWPEKQAMEPVIEGICDEYRVDFFSCRGYASMSSLYEAGRRMAGYYARGQRPIVFHLGDHDPSGIDMTRDNQERLSIFAGVQVQVVRLALNMNQVEHHRLPPNPAKMSDSRAEAYVAEHGSSSWELDALPAAAIRDLIGSTLYKLRDEVRWDEMLAQEVADKESMDLAMEGMV